MADDRRNTTLEKGVDSKHAESQQEGVLAEGANRSSYSEHQMTLLKAVKTYPKAIGWSVLLSRR